MMASLAESFKRDKQVEKMFLSGVVVTDQILGAGSYGSVLEVKYKGDLCAAKQVHNILLEHGNEGIERLVERFKLECHLMASVSHPNLTKFIGLCFLKDSQLPLLVMEKMAMDLVFLLENVPCLPLSNKVSILHDTCNGLAYLHDLEPPIIHRDLTARNILLTSTLSAKISDLGNSKKIAPKPRYLATTLSKYPGTLVYMPPEALDEEHRYGPSLDIFSFGHLSLYTLTQRFPRVLGATYMDPDTGVIKGRSEEERRCSSMTLLKVQLEETHPSLVEMVSKCLHNHPAKRPSIVTLQDQLQGAMIEVERELEASPKILEITMKGRKIQKLHHPSEDNADHANHVQLEQLQKKLDHVLKERDQMKLDLDTLQQAMIQQREESSKMLVNSQKELSDCKSQIFQFKKALEQLHVSKDSSKSAQKYCGLFGPGDDEDVDLSFTASKCLSASMSVHSGGKLFGSDDEDEDDLFFTSTKTDMKSIHAKDKKNATQAAEFGDGNLVSADTHSFIASDNKKALPESWRTMGKYEGLAEKDMGSENEEKKEQEISEKACEVKEANQIKQSERKETLSVSSSEGDEVMVNISLHCKAPDVVHAIPAVELHEGREYPGYILLTTSTMMVLRELSDREGWGKVKHRHTLDYVLRISAKKEHPDIITFRFGTGTGEERVVIEQLLFRIPNTTKATAVIKDQIIKYQDSQRSQRSSKKKLL